MNAPHRLIERPERLRLRVRDFEMLAENGAFVDYGKTELIDGDIYVMNSQMARHARAKVRLLSELIGALKAIGSDLEVLSEVSVRVADDSMPEPDLVLSAYRGDGWVPGGTIAVVIEVSDTTLDTDLGRKAELYAVAGIPEYWVVDLNGGRFVLHSQPGVGGYRARREVGWGEPLISSAVEGLRIESDKLLG